MAAKKKPAKKSIKKSLTKPDVVKIPPTSAIKQETRRRQLFIKEYLIDLNGKQAAIRAGYSEASARSIGSELLQVPQIRAAIDAGMAARAQKLDANGEWVVSRLLAIARADASLLTEVQVNCCRHCWGLNFKYQFTPREMQDAVREFRLQKSEFEADNPGKSFTQEFDQLGGTGFNPTLDPNSKCPECFGRGIRHVIAKDTRDIPEEARILFAGVKETQHGIEVKTHDQHAALRDLGRHFGLFQDKMKHSNDPDNPMPAATAYIAMIPAKADPDDPGAK